MKSIKIKRCKPTFYKLALIAMFFTLSASSCEKEQAKPTLPPETQEGKNTFGCYINGELFLWQRGSASFGHPSLSANYRHSTRSLSINAYSRNGTINLRVFNPEVNKKITLAGAFYTLKGKNDIWGTYIVTDTC